MDTYEQKYKEALVRPDVIFPELTESDDEKIRKALIETLKYDAAEKCLNSFGINKFATIAWLEKQGEQKPYGQRQECVDCQFNYAGECKGYCAMKKDEQKSADKVEPKFKVGDYVVGKYISGYISEVRDDCYLLDYQGFSIDKQDNYHLWTIQDAKVRKR